VFERHFRRFFVGWGLFEEVLFHTKGALSVSSLLHWNSNPMLRFGVTFR
jgi:hypothetical protein